MENIGQIPEWMENVPVDLTFGPAFWFSIVFSLLGMGYFIYGKKQSDIEFLLGGIALMAYPYFVRSAVYMGLIGIALIATPFLAKRFL